MEYEDKTKEQLLEELAVMHYRIAELEKPDTKRKRSEVMLKKSQNELL
jgi:hypothetical protein